MKIRKAKKNELTEIGNIMLEEFSKPPFGEKEKLKSVLKSLNFYYANANIYIALEGGIKGVLIFQIERWWEGIVIIVQDLVAKDESKNRGIGKTLLNFLEDYCKKENASRIVFQTHKKSPSLKFYKKLGYKINKDIILMEKKI